MNRFITFILCLIALNSVMGAVKLNPVVSNLEQPVSIVFHPSEKSTFYVLEQKGKIRKVVNGVLDASPVLDIQEQVTSGGEMGLLGLALHPGFASNGRYFINYTARVPNLKTIVSEFNLNSAKERQVLSFSQPYQNHNGGHMDFGPDGYLYITAGDGGSAADPHGNGQSLSTLLGKMLRIDVSSVERYDIPKDNPFTKTAGARPEIFAYGLRNAWKFSFDKKTGALFAGDVGQDRYEEIDVIEKGGNYGWNTMEGKHCFSPATGCDQNGLILPIHEYSRSSGNSITGGYVYRGTEIPELAGAYIYGDFGSGKIWALHYDQTTKTVLKNELLLNSHLSISTFGQDNQGEVYVADYSGKIFKLSRSN